MFLSGGSSGCFGLSFFSSKSSSSHSMEAKAPTSSFCILICSSDLSMPGIPRHLLRSCFFLSRSSLRISISVRSFISSSEASVSVCDVAISSSVSSNQPHLELQLSLHSAQHFTPLVPQQLQFPYLLFPVMHVLGQCCCSSASGRSAELLHSSLHSPCLTHSQQHSWAQSVPLPGRCMYSSGKEHAYSGRYKQWPICCFSAASIGSFRCSLVAVSSGSSCDVAISAFSSSISSATGISWLIGLPATGWTTLSSSAVSSSSTSNSSVVDASKLSALSSGITPGISFSSVCPGISM